VNRREVRAQLRAKMQEIREQVAELPAVKQAQARRRRRRRLIMLCILLLLAALIRCDCEPEPVGEVEDAGVAVDAGKPTRDAGVPKAKLSAKVQTQHRGGYGLETPAPPTWLDEFMLQVTSRSPRLAQCFTGQDRPGVLRWTSSINARSGIPSDHELELVGGGKDLNPEQRRCVLSTLSYPPYKLTAPDAGGLPDRVSVVLEF
jgi:hypothetical protein